MTQILGTDIHSAFKQAQTEYRQRRMALDADRPNCRFPLSYRERAIIMTAAAC
ncbi:hypothetical protein [Alkalilimnicola ehrlichii]|uniref:hypothetical protein n=1 Tax=Alkalilimnicola ehrlichii TaxID=351052 RepID=UPI0015F259E4|nr:hypothetical protein [Alkalilimnicola ehrlichii]